MRIAVMATGGVGGYFGARLARAGHDVAFIARGRHLEAIRERGLRIESVNGDVHLDKVSVTDDPAELAPVDVVIFAVKLWDTEDAARRLQPLVDAGAFIVPFQNGVDSIDRVGAIVGAERVLGGAAYIAATIGGPGVIVHTGTMARLRFGAVHASQQPIAEALLAACRAAGIDATLERDIRRALWEKFVFLATLSGLTTLTRQSLGVLRADADLRAVFEAAMAEVRMIAVERGIALADDFVAGQMALLDTLPFEMTSSMHRDLIAGNRLEAPWLSGAVARMARESAAAAPVHSTIYAALKPYCAGSRA